MSTFFNGNIENQSDNINSYFTVDSNGVLQFQAALNVPTSITCDTINANTQNIINTNNENVTGYVHATADVISNYGSNPSYSLNYIGAQMATLATDTTAISILQQKTQYQTSTTGNTTFINQTTFQGTTSTSYINMDPNGIFSSGYPSINCGRGVGGIVYADTLNFTNQTGANITTNKLNVLNNSGSSTITLDPTAVYPLSVNGNSVIQGTLNVNSGGSFAGDLIVGGKIKSGTWFGNATGNAFTFDNASGTTLSTIDQNGNLNINSLTITGTGTSILLNRSDAQIDYQGNASLGQITGTLIRSTNDVISNYGSNNYSLNATASGLGTANSQISILNNQVNTLNNEYITTTSQINTLNNNVSSNTALIGTANSQITILNNNVSSNTALIGTHTSQINTLNNNVSSNTALIGTQTSQISILNSQVSGLTSLNSKIIYVSKSGDDSNNGLSSATPVLTITKAITLASSASQICIYAGTYSESPTCSIGNVTISSINNSSGGEVLINGTLTCSCSSPSSIRVQGLSINTLNSSGSGALYVFNCHINSGLNVSSNGYFEMSNSDSSACALSFTNSNFSNIYNCKVGSTTINNASALVNFSNCLQIIGPLTITSCAGVGINNCSVQSAGTSGNVISATSGYILLNESSVVYSNLNPANISLGSSTTYDIRLSNYNKAGSTISGVLVPQNVYSQNVNINSLAVGAITAGQWGGSNIGIGYGGTGSNLSSSGGVGQVLQQSTTGANITVGTLDANTLGGTQLNSNIVRSSLTQVGALTSGALASGFNVVGVALGGSGVASSTPYAPIAGGTTSTGAHQSLDTGISSVGYVLTSNGSSALPTWQPASGGGLTSVSTLPALAPTITFSTPVITPSTFATLLNPALDTATGGYFQTQASLTNFGTVAEDSGNVSGANSSYTFTTLTGGTTYYFRGRQAGLYSSVSPWSSVISGVYLAYFAASAVFSMGAVANNPITQQSQTNYYGTNGNSWTQAQRLSCVLGTQTSNGLTVNDCIAGQTSSNPICIDIGASRSISKVVLKLPNSSTPGGWGGYNFNGWTLQYWNGSSWSTAYTFTTLPTVGSTSSILSYTFTAASGRYWQINPQGATNTYSVVGLLQLYGS